LSDAESRLRLRAAARWTSAFIAPDLPVGLIFRNRVKPCQERYFSLSEAQIRRRVRLSRGSHRGALRDRHETWRGGRWTLVASTDERGQGGRRNRVVLVPRRWDQACGRRIRRRRRL